MEVAVRGVATPADDADKFRAWVAPHLLAMGRLATRLTSSHDSDDVVQEALVRAWRKRSQYDESRGTTQAWLLAIVADRARRHRSRMRSHGHQLIDLPTPTRDLAGSVDLERAIAGLPRRQRLAVELHYMLGLDVRECGAVMNCSEGTVKSTLYDARSRLREFLEVVDPS
jgi:RNA polymerase sigma-70 factor (ECF subfamily)